MTDKNSMCGGCMCGAVRYEAIGDNHGVTHCHCHSCRKHNGGPVVTLAGYKNEQVSFSGDQRKIYESSPGVGRAFCGNCGTPLTWEGESGDLGYFFEFHLSTFDEPEKLIPTSHAFEPERISWFDIADDLPRYEGFSEDSPILHHGPVTEGLPSRQT